ncbi:RNA polymerase sigma factor [Flavobacterium degerlachei]|jgi:RNA polymerase sigma-70 factor (ECF subfamily)|uniref:RNA polymerase sigma-70 factor, ECF subfamily n=1 Tax=Flavobacterium degerlachei TaxID=229203 RepID=A0A1H3E329_9FLAO|nr:sigma-70 family RNA polymerase sigma factor [Flavobacterium degerlachei]SDX73085.1 RNA polymerase sigma-70 factor, ECF subfamily [Flavobacterium degerlachei]
MGKQKEHEFFEEIIERNKHKIFRICRIYAAAPLEPQDLFQEVIFQIWKSLEKFEGKSSVDTWIYKITINVCLRSKMKFDKSNSKTDRFESIHFSPVEKEIDTSEQEKFKFLKECISTLNETDTSLIVLYLDDLSYKEIAVITGLSENHIAVKMKRIREKLFECITSKIK